MSQDKIQKARELVLNYIATHSLSDKLNRAVNEVCKSRPKDPWLFLTDIISEWTKDVPIIDRLVAKQGIDSNGNSSLQLQLYGRVSSSRPPRFLGSENIFINNSVDDDNKDADDDNDNDIKLTISTISSLISPALRSIRIDEQNKIDNQLSTVFNKNNMVATSSYFNIIPTISSLIANISSSYTKIGLYKYLTDIIDDNNNMDDDVLYNLPNIQCELISFSTNKLPSIHLITTSTNNLIPIKKIAMIRNITDELIKLLNISPNSVIYDNITGGIIVDDNFSILDDILNIVIKAIDNCGYHIIQDIQLGLSFSNNPTYIQYKNNQYFLNNKSLQIADYFVDLVDKYPSIKYIEDPLIMNEADLNGYTKLTSLLNNKCNIIGNKLYKSSLNLIKNGINKKLTSSICINNNEIFTISSCFEIYKIIRNNNNNNPELIISDNCNNNSISTYLIDLSITLNAKIIRLSLPNNGKSTNKYNRYLAIYDELSILQGTSTANDNDNDQNVADNNDNNNTNSPLPPSYNDQNGLNSSKQKLNGNIKNKNDNIQNNNNNNNNAIDNDVDKPQDLP